MATSATPLLNARMQSDSSGGGGFAFSGFEALGAKRGGVIYVDSTLSRELGSRDTSMPFLSLRAAIAASQPGDTIIIRPGEYILETYLQLKKAGVTILGYGARLVSDVPNGGMMVLITAGHVTIEGIEFDGLFDVAASDTTDGCITLNGADYVTLRNLSIHDHAGYGIYAAQRYDRLFIEHCTIVNCVIGINAETAVQASRGLDIDRCVIGSCRVGGISVAGAGTDSFLSTQINITNCNLLNNEDAGIIGSAINVSDGIADATVIGNIIYGSQKGVNVSKAKRVLVANNNIRGAQTEGIGFIGCIGWEAVGNFIDGRADNGNVTGKIGIAASGFYAVENDAGQGLVSGNTIVNLDSPGRVIDFWNVSDVNIVGNEFSGGVASLVYILASFGVTISANRFNFVSEVPIRLDALQRGLERISIIGNRFYHSGVVAALIATVDTVGAGQNEIHIVGNSSPAGKTYSSYTYAPTGTVSNAVIAGNMPNATTRVGGVIVGQNGWANDNLILNRSDQFDIASGSAVGFSAAGIKVVGTRVTGFAADTGTAEKTAHATYTAPTISNPPTQAEVQAIATALQGATRGQKAIKEALIAHGLVGT